MLTFNPLVVRSSRTRPTKKWVCPHGSVGRGAGPILEKHGPERGRHQRYGRKKQHYCYSSSR